MRHMQFLLPLTPYPYVGAPVPCSLCGGVEGHVVSRWDRRLKKLTTLCCAKCGMVRTDPMPSETELNAYYGGEYRLDYQMASDHPPARHILKSQREALRRKDIVAPGLSAGDAVLDLGSGSGEFVSVMKQAGYRSKGLEPGAAYAEWSRKEYGIDVESAPYGSARIEPGSVKLVTAHHVIEHLRDPFDAFSTIHRWLAPDGLFYVSVPNIADPFKPTFERFHFAHIWGFAPETLEMMGLKAGFVRDPRFVFSDPTSMVFAKKSEAPGEWFIYPDAADRIMAALPVTPMRRHVLSGAWAAPMIKKARRYLRDGRASRSGS